MRNFIMGGSKSTADGNCSPKVKRRLLLGRKAMINLDNILKNRDIIILSTKACLVKALVFPVVMYGYESWTIKKAEHRRIDAFELCCWRSLLRVPWTARRSNQSIVKEISPEYSWLISFRMDWFDLLAVQGTQKSLVQHHSSKASILRCSAFFIVQLSHPYMTTENQWAIKTKNHKKKIPVEPNASVSRRLIKLVSL